MSKAEEKALAMAYNFVTRLGWTHTKICVQHSISMPTLRRINRGQDLRIGTREYAMKVFIEIAKEEYFNDLSSGGLNNSAFDKFFREVLFALHDISD